MPSHLAETQGVDIFQVPLQGFMVECESIEDAVAVKNSDAFICGRDTVTYTPAELETMAAVLKRYGRRSAAEILVGQANRIRAAELLSVSADHKKLPR
jgi:hypothetical protein